MTIPPHPVLVHFPIAFFFLEAALLLRWVKENNSQHKYFALFVFKIAFAFLPAVIAAGIFDAGGFSGIRGPVKAHFISGILLFLFSAARAWYWKFGREASPAYRFLLIGGSLLGILLVCVTSFLGGSLVYG